MSAYRLRDVTRFIQHWLLQQQEISCRCLLLTVHHYILHCLVLAALCFYYRVAADFVFHILY